MYIALLSLKPLLYVSIASTRHFCAHTPHPLHFSSFMYRLLLFISTLKFLGSPDRPSTLALVTRMMFGCLPASTSLGARIHIEQSFVGKVLSSWPITPPMLEDCSTKYTLKPKSATSKAACTPATPPPTTRTAPILPSVITEPPKLWRKKTYAVEVLRLLSLFCASLECDAKQRW